MRFHAVPPPGQWFNDPVGLVRSGGMWRLFVQHRQDAPAFKETGWARLSSADLLDWHWDGPVLPADGERWAYSGSVLPDTHGGALHALYTLHERGIEQQVGAMSLDDGASWSPQELTSPAAARGRNRRDPFVFRDQAGEWHMLLAHPADWQNWRDEPPSEVHRYRSADGREWTHDRVEARAPEPGLLWEMPTEVEVDGRSFVIVSEVDRRAGDASCRVLARLAGEDGFMPLDQGPDFYAGIPARTADGSAMIVGWASSWQTARRMPWDGFAGGPISLPRRLKLIAADGNIRLGQVPFMDLSACWKKAAGQHLDAGVATARIDGHQPFRFLAKTDASEVMIAAEPGRREHLAIRHAAEQAFRWDGSGLGVVPAAERVITVVVDGKLIEFFDETSGLAWTVAMPGSCAPQLRLEVGGAAQPLRWYAPQP